VLDGAALLAIVDEVLGKHADKVEQYRGGKTGLLGFFVGQVVKASAGKADAAQVQKLLGQRLS
jgi:Asp-tRNA(Asn)/Glu-tRNA(Gln) amidotransferase B subunit